MPVQPSFGAHFTRVSGIGVWSTIESTNERNSKPAVLAYATIVTDRVAVRDIRNPSRRMTLALRWSSAQFSAVLFFRCAGLRAMPHALEHADRRGCRSIERLEAARHRNRHAKGRRIS
jgi:hypothetical protein